MAKLDSMTYQVKLLIKFRGIRKDRTILEKLNLIVRPDGI